MRKSTKGRGPVIVAALGTVVVALLFFGSPSLGHAGGRNPSRCHRDHGRMACWP